MSLRWSGDLIAVLTVTLAWAAACPQCTLTGAAALTLIGGCQRPVHTADLWRCDPRSPNSPNSPSLDELNRLLHAGQS